MSILNCCATVLPPHDAPQDEWYRDACRLYVTMTRTKRQLLLSYSGNVSPWLSNCSDLLNVDKWGEYVDLHSIERLGVPEMLRDVADNRSILEFTGEEFLYSSQALGLSAELQERVATLVDGRGQFVNGRREKWRTIGEALRDVRNDPRAKQLFGLITHREFLGLFDGPTAP